MFPIVAWWVELDYFARILHSSCGSHTLAQSLSTMIHFFGLWLAVSNSTVVNSAWAKHNTRLSDNSVFWTFSFPQRSYIRSSGLDIALFFATAACFTAAQEKREQFGQREWRWTNPVLAAWLKSKLNQQLLVCFLKLLNSCQSQPRQVLKVEIFFKMLGKCLATGNLFRPSRKGLRVAHYFFQEGLFVSRSTLTGEMFGWPISWSIVTAASDKARPASRKPENYPAAFHHSFAISACSRQKQQEREAAEGVWRGHGSIRTIWEAHRQANALKYHVCASRPVKTKTLIRSFWNANTVNA